HAPAPTAVHTLSLHDALPIFLEGDQGANEVALSLQRQGLALQREGAEGVVGGRLFEEGLVKRERGVVVALGVANVGQRQGGGQRSEEHTSELQSRENLVCRLL